MRYACADTAALSELWFIMTLCYVVIFHKGSEFYLCNLITGNNTPRYSNHLQQHEWLSGERVRLWSSGLWSNSESCQTNDFKIGIHSFPALRSVLKGHCGEQAGEFACCTGKKGT